MKMMHIKSKTGLTALLITLILAGCQCGSAPSGKDNPYPEDPHERQIQNQREFLEKERASIEHYITDRKLAMERSGTGLYYTIVKDSVFGGTAETGDVVMIDFSISLLNGEVLYTSQKNGPRTLRIDKEEAEIGLHEALKQLGVGDEGLFILPSHLAFGVAGDQNKVPPVTALAYEIKMLQLEKSK